MKENDKGITQHFGVNLAELLSCKILEVHNDCNKNPTLRPKLPWAAKLDTFNDNPEPVFKILEILKEDEIMFVKKSVANVDYKKSDQKNKY